MNIHTSNIQAVMYNNQSFKRAYYGETLIFPSSSYGYEIMYNDIINPSSTYTNVMILSGIFGNEFPTSSLLETYFWDGIDHIDLIDNNDKVVKRYSNTLLDKSKFTFNAMGQLGYTIYLKIDSSLISGYLPELQFYFKKDFYNLEIRKYFSIWQNNNVHFITVNTKIITRIPYASLNAGYSTVDKTKPISFKFIGPNVIEDKQISMYGINGWVRNSPYTTIYIPKEYKDSYNTLLNALTKVPDSQKILY